MPAVDRRRWTAREVRTLIEENPLASPRYELVDGELLVTPSPAYPHQRVLSRLHTALAPYLALHHCGEIAWSPSDVELEDETIVQPDLFVLGYAEARRLMTTKSMPIRELLLAIEGLSPSSARHDRVKKRPLYQRHVPEYWIVDLEARLIERWSLNDDRPEILAERLEWHPAGASEPFMLDVGALFAAVLDE